VTGWGVFGDSLWSTWAQFQHLPRQQKKFGGSQPIRKQIPTKNKFVVDLVTTLQHLPWQ
jgi:hypothetical protein